MAIPMKGKEARETFEDFESMKKSARDYKKGLKPKMEIPWSLIAAVIVVLIFLFWGRF